MRAICAKAQDQGSASLEYLTDLDRRAKRLIASLAL